MFPTVEHKQIKPSRKDDMIMPEGLKRRNNSIASGYARNMMNVNFILILAVPICYPLTNAYLDNPKSKCHGESLYNTIEKGIIFNYF